jgi:hypothetical protein
MGYFGAGLERTIIVQINIVLMLKPLAPKHVSYCTMMQSLLGLPKSSLATATTMELYTRQRRDGINGLVCASSNITVLVQKNTVLVLYPLTSKHVSYWDTM